MILNLDTVWVNDYTVDGRQMIIKSESVAKTNSVRQCVTSYKKLTLLSSAFSLRFTLCVSQSSISVCMKFLGLWPPESSLPRSDNGEGSAPSEEHGDAGGTVRTFSILP